jgi:diacylglycerol kinase family enzyme
MPSALFLYSDATGQGQVNRNLDKILFRLRKRFEPLDVVKTQSMEEGMRRAVDSCGKYDVLIFSGGDGTFNHIASSLVGKENAPTLGYINGGTIGDIGQNFGIHRSYKSALKIIEQGHTCGFDMGQVNDMWFTYVAAVGAFADLAEEGLCLTYSSVEELFAILSGKQEIDPARRTAFIRNHSWEAFARTISQLVSAEG